MATTQYKDNAERIYEFQQEAGDAGGAEKRPVAGMPAQVRTQLADMTTALLGLAGTVLAGSLKVVLQASNAVIGKLAPNAGVNIGTVGLAAGTANIGDVDVLSLPSLPAGTNAIGKLAANVGVNIGAVDVVNALQLPASLGQRNMATSLGVTIASDQSPVLVSDGGAPLMVIGNGGNPLPVSGTVTVGNSLVVHLGTSLPAGNMNIGDVDVASLPPLPTGNNNIGDVDIASMPSLPAGANAIGKLAPNAGVNIGTVGLAAGTANIGDVDVLSLPSLPAGTNNIGTVKVAAPGTAVVNVVPTSFTAVTFAAANAARVGLIVVNSEDASSELYLKFGSGASSTSWTMIIQPGGFYEMPPHYYSGIVTGIWLDWSRAVPVGDAHVTETA